VAAGQVEFGITSADSLLMARDRGADLVAIYAAYQTFPEGIMVHASRGLESMAAATFAEATIIQKPLIQGQLDDATLGTMTLERWRTLAEQLEDLGLIERAEPEGAFVNP